MSDVQGYRVSSVEEVVYGKREITLIAVPYEQETTVNDGNGPLREKFARSSFAGIEAKAGKVTANRDHSLERVFGLAKQFDSKSEKGLITVIRAADTELGTETLQLAAEGVLKASVAFSARSYDAPIRDGLRTVYKAQLRHIAMTPEPAYDGAEVIDVRTGEPIVHPEMPNLSFAKELLRGLQSH